MSLQGKAFLCVWNDHDPDQAAEYEAWHTFEHVPERVCVPGFIAGRRYADYDRPASRYLTLYDLDSLGVLDTAYYQDLQDNPTPWSRKMRGAFRNFLRIPCEIVVTRGEGCGGALGVLAFKAFKDKAHCIDAVSQYLATELANHNISSYHVGRASNIPAYNVFDMPAVSSDEHETYVVMAEGLSTHDTDAVLAGLSNILRTFGQAQIVKNESSRLLFGIRQVELPDNFQYRRVHCKSDHMSNGRGQ